MGWVGFAILFVYNIAFIIYLCIDIGIGIRFTNRERVENGRNVYYRKLLCVYEEYQRLDEEPSDDEQS